MRLSIFCVVRRCSLGAIGMRTELRLALSALADREVAPDHKAARFSVVPLHKHLDLVGVPDRSDTPDAVPRLLDSLALAWDVARVRVEQFVPFSAGSPPSRDRRRVGDRFLGFESAFYE